MSGRICDEEGIRGVSAWQLVPVQCAVPVGGCDGAHGRHNYR